MKFIFILLSSLFLFFTSISILIKKWRNPWKLYMIFGKKGSGKSTFLVRECIKALLKGKLVYTNMTELNIDGVRYINPSQLGAFVPIQDSVLLLDEVGMLWDNRHFKEFNPRTRDFFKLQRHYHVTCFLASQTWDVDKKIRDLFDGAYLCINIFGCVAINKRIMRKIVLTESTSDSESRIAENLKFAPVWNWKFTWIPKWTKYFNSFQTPEIEEIPYEKNTAGVALKQLLRRNVQKQLKDLKQENNLKKAKKKRKNNCVGADGALHGDGCHSDLLPAVAPEGLPEPVSDEEKAFFQSYFQ